MLKTKKGFLLRRLGKQHMIVAIGAASKEFNGMIRTNETGAWFWSELQKGTTEDALVAKMLERYEGLDEATARADLKEFLSAVSVALVDDGV